MTARYGPRYFVIGACLITVAASTSFCDSENFVVEWMDEFEGEDINSDYWSRVCFDNEDCVAPFPTHAATDHGAECRSAICMSDYVSVSDGYLTLTSARNPDNSSEWLTGAVKTQNKIDWSTDQGTYRLCIVAKVPGGSNIEGGTGQGIWPAHWMMPADDSCDPDEGEMDIFEMVDGNGLAESTYHWQNNWPNETCAYPDGHEEVWGSLDLGSDWAESFHEFSVERSADHIVFAVDGIVIVNSSNYTVPSSLSTSTMKRHNMEIVGTSNNPADDIKLWPIPFYLILNSAVGGGWPGEPDETTASPTYHVIDSVRVVREIVN